MLSFTLRALTFVHFRTPQTLEGALLFLLFFLSETIHILKTLGVSKLAIDGNHLVGLGIKVEISYDICTALLAQQSKFGECLEDLGSKLFNDVNVGLHHNVSERVHQLDFFNRTVEFLVDAVLEAHLRIEKHLESSILLLCNLVCLIEAVHTVATTTKSFQYKHTHFRVHHFETTQVVQDSVGFFLFGQLFCIEVHSAFQVKSRHVDLLKVLLYQLHQIGCLVG